LLSLWFARLLYDLRFDLPDCLLSMIVSQSSPMRPQLCRAYLIVEPEI
jgi:hypothetical protein